MTTEVQLWANTLVCQFCGVICKHRMTFGVAGTRVLCGPDAKPFLDLILYPAKGK